MQTLGIIGGSGLTRLKALSVERQEVITTPYGEPSAPLTFGRFDGTQVVFLPRHGPSHTIPPHRVNYRANLWAMREAGVERIIGMAAGQPRKGRATAAGARQRPLHAGAGLSQGAPDRADYHPA